MSPIFSASPSVSSLPLSGGLVNCKLSRYSSFNACESRHSQVGDSSLLHSVVTGSSSIAAGQSIVNSKRVSKCRLDKISCTAMAPQVEVQSGAPSPAVEHPWILEICIPPEATAGFREEYKAEAKTWPSDLETTTNFEKFEEFVISAHTLARKWLPRDVVRRLEKFSHDPSQPSALVIRGLPIDEDLPPTTTQGLKLKVGKYMSETWLIGIARIIGQPFYLTMSPQTTTVMEMVFRDILPRPSENDRVSMYGSSAFLNLHCDYFQCIQECFVHTLAFIGIRGDPQKVGRTLLADFRQVYNRTSAEDVQTLREQPLTWRFGSDPDKWFTQHVIVGSEDNPHLYLFDEFVDSLQFDDLIQGNTEAIGAYKRMKDLACDLSLQQGGVRLETGDVLLLNQRRVAHGRNSFEAKYDGNDRWMQKVFVNEGQIWQPHGLVPWPERLLPYISVKKVVS